MRPAAGQLNEIPGLGLEVAAALIAEIDLDMSRFPVPEALVSWAALLRPRGGPAPAGPREKGHGNTVSLAAHQL